MSLLLSVVLVVASVALLHFGRWYVGRPGVSGPNGRSFAGELFALVFTTLFSLGVILTIRDGVLQLDASHMLKAALALAVAWLGSKWVARVSRRLQARVPAAPAV